MVDEKEEEMKKKGDKDSEEGSEGEDNSEEVKEVSDEESEEEKKEEIEEEDSEEENKREVSEGESGEKEDEKEDESKIGEDNEEKKSPVKKIHYLIVGIVLVALVFVYAGGGSVSGDVVLENHLEGICDDPEGDANDFYTKGEVKAGDDETGRVGFTDTCLKTFYDGRLDDIGLAFYFRSLAKYGAIDEEMTKDMDVLFEGYCPASLTQTFEEVDPFMLIATYKCPNGCEDGACIS